MARLDTGWHANSKVLGVGLQGMGMHAWSISYCDHARTDGFIPMGAWPSLPGAGAAVKSLIVAGLWERVAGGFRLHDYPEYNRTRAEIEERQESARERQSRHRSRVTDGVTQRVTNGVSDGVTLARGAAPGPGPGPGVTLKRDTPSPPNPLTDQTADAQGPTGTASAPPGPKWTEVAPGQFRGTPGGQGSVELLKVRCPRCERSLLVSEVDDHECELVPGAPVQPTARPGNLAGFLPRSRPKKIPPEVEAELQHMATHRPTPEEIAAEVARIGQTPSAS